VATLRLNSGVTLPPLSGGGTVTLGAFTATLNGETVNFVDPDGDGTFEARFRFLVPGTYALSVQVPAGLGVSTNLSLPVDVTVDSGETENVAVVIQSAFVVP